MSSDHRLLMATVRLRLKRFTNANSTRIKYNVGLLRNKGTQAAFQISLSNRFQPLQELIEDDETGIETQWEHCKKLWHDTTLTATTSTISAAATATTNAITFTTTVTAATTTTTNAAAATTATDTMITLAMIYTLKNMHSVSQNFNPAAKDPHGFTALHYACMYNRTSLVRAIIAAAPSAVRVATPDGLTPLDLARCMGNWELAFELIGMHGAHRGEGFDETEVIVMFAA